MSYAMTTETPDRHRPPAPRERLRSGWMLVAFLAIGALAGGIGVLSAVGTALGWYPSIPRVSWAPPPGLLSVVRVGIFLATGLAEWLIWLRRRDRRVAAALTLFVGQQALSTAWPILYNAGYGVLGLADLWICVAVLLLLDLLIAATAFTFWSLSRTAGAIVGVHLVSTLLSTALVLGSAGMHAVL